MERFIRIYLYILPIFSLIGIIFSAFRTAYQFDYGEYLILFSAIFDLFIIWSGWKRLFNKIITFVFLYLTISLLIGLLSNEISRRFITDFTNPFFFFAKIYIFKAYWGKVEFSKYLSNYYIKVTFWGSLLLLPIVYFIFTSAGATRLSIFPPMELPFSYYMQSSGLFFISSLIIILLYGKRAQLIGAILTFFVYIFVFKSKDFFKFLIIGLIGFMVLSIIFEKYSENYAIRRFVSTFEQIDGNEQDGMEKVAGSRAVEVESILREMDGPFDYFFGKGLGFEYHFVFNEIEKMQANAHFTPIALLSKYGFLFSVFIYIFLFRIFFKYKRNLFDRYYLTAIGTSIFVFFESFFAYAFFVTPIFPIVLGYIMHRQESIKISKL